MEKIENKAKEIEKGKQSQPKTQKTDSKTKIGRKTNRKLIENKTNKNQYKKLKQNRKNGKQIENKTKQIENK